MINEIKTSWLTLPGGQRAFYAFPAASGKYPVIVVLFEAFGLNAHFQELAARLARQGYCAVVPDLFMGKVFNYTELSGAMEAVKSLDENAAMQQITQTIDALRARGEADILRCGIIGFCMGGRLSFLAACKLGSKLKAAVAFYGGSIAPTGPDRLGRASVLTEENLTGLSAPLFLAYGSEDHHIPPEEHARIVAALGRHKKRYTIALFNGPHAFASEGRDSFRPDAAQQAWKMAYDHFAIL
jgi:carboxymethylenebutenolidase